MKELFDKISLNASKHVTNEYSTSFSLGIKMLNKSKGPAMWSPRAQSDRMRFAESWRNMLEKTKNLDFYQEMVSGILVSGDKVVGVKTSLGLEIHSKSVILTNGTFLNGLIHIGEKKFGGGRAGEKASFGITEVLTDFGFASSASGIKISNKPFAKVASTFPKSNLGAILYLKSNDFLDKPL